MDYKGDKMKKTLVLCSIGIAMLTACSSETENALDITGVQNITVEVLDTSDKSIDSVSLNEVDIALAKDILSEGIQSEEEGFVFAEGMYRLELEYKDRTVNLYPYCGNASTFRVGDSGAVYIKMETQQQEAFEEVIEKYIDIKGGIWEWEEYEDN